MYGGNQPRQPLICLYQPSYHVKFIHIFTVGVCRSIITLFLFTYHLGQQEMTTQVSGVNAHTTTSGIPRSTVLVDQPATKQRTAVTVWQNAVDLAGAVCSCTVQILYTCSGAGCEELAPRSAVQSSDGIQTDLMVTDSHSYRSTYYTPQQHE